MLPVCSAKEIQAADAYTIAHEPIASIDLMERAAESVVAYIQAHLAFFKDKTVSVFCGTGNNGGDGLAVARLLIEQGYLVDCFVSSQETVGSADYEINKQCFPGELKEWSDINDLSSLTKDSILIDAIFGTGLNRKVEGKYAELINLINRQKCFKLSIDLPSGMQADGHSSSSDSIVSCNLCLTFEVPKYCLLQVNMQNFMKHWEVLSIGLHKDFFKGINFQQFLIQAEDIAQLYKKRAKTAFKNQMGHLYLMAGSSGKFGASLLSAKAAMRTGLGLLTVQIPKEGRESLHTYLPEAMLVEDNNAQYLSEDPNWQKVSALAIGPGIGTETETVQLLKRIIQQSALPMVMDADALNILAENKTWLSFLPPNCILTPHVGEFKRLVGDYDGHQEAIEKLQCFAKKYQCHILLKGPYTAMAAPDGKVFYNPTGNAGMATAGSGDTLTGIIAGLLAQGYPTESAMILGVYFHGLAGDIAAEKIGEEAMIASDLTLFLGEAIQKIKQLVD